MKFSESWLRSFVNPALSSEALAHALTMAGLEVEERVPAAPPFEGVVVGEIKSFEKHPNADRLNVCQVDVGQPALLNIVCGAPNVAAGMKVPCALVGAALPPDAEGKKFEIKRAKMRGVESEGMLCSARELGMSDDHTGLLPLPSDAAAGANVRAVLDLDDSLFTIKLTPNRADALSVLGVAREVAALTGATMTTPSFAPVRPVIEDRIAVTVHDKDLCGRFSGRLVKGVNARAATPQWMKDRLERSGQRPISALVDISNYIMLELGRPSHIFDAAKIAGRQLHVRWGKNGEQVKLLNGQTVTVDATVGVIADGGASGGSIEALAGIMGGDATAVNLDTTEIFIEAAFWWPQAIQGRARRFHFTTEAGHRFERGVDFSTTVAHIERITALVLDICGGQPGPVDDQILDLPKREPVRMRVARCRKVLGIALEKREMTAAFGRLGLPVTDLGEALEVTPPAYRFDLTIEEDLIEEVARIHGFDNIPAEPPRARAAMMRSNEAQRSILSLKQILAARDYREVINYSFVDDKWERDFGERDLAGNADPVKLLNPIASQMSVMRSNLFGGLVANVVYNVNRKQARVRAFEVGTVFRRAVAAIDGPLTVAGFAQPRMIGAIAFGPAYQEQWGIRSQTADFFDLKGEVEALLSPLVATFEAAPHPALHPGRSARIVLEGAVIGHIGELHPKWVREYGLPAAPVLFEVEVAAIVQLPLVAHAGVSKFPPVFRDISLALDAAIPAFAVLATIQAAASRHVTGLQLFDLYRPSKPDSGLAETEKSLAFRVVMQDTQKTLTDAEADETIRLMVESAQKKHQARIRA